MTCQRCAGLMVSEWIYDPKGLSSEVCREGYRCLLCGNVVDPTILINKQRGNGGNLDRVADQLSAVIAGGGDDHP